jgi:hypothetical protein
VITDFLDSGNNASSPGMIRFENEWGGRIAVMAFNLDDTYIHSRSCSIFNYTKKQVIYETIEWLGKEALPVFIRHAPNVFCILNRSKSDNYLIAVLINLSTDTIDGFSLDIAPEWSGSKIELMGPGGAWKRIQTERKDNSLRLNVSLALMDPVILKLPRNV